MSRPQVERLTTLTGHKDCVYSLERHPDDSRFFSAGGDGMVVEWDLEDPENGYLVAQVANSVYALHYHDDSRRLIVGHNYEGIHIVDPEERKETGSLKMTEDAIFDIVSFRNKLFVATGGGEIVVVDIKTLTIDHRVKVSDHRIRSLSIHADEWILVAGSSDNFIRFFDLRGLSLVNEIEAHQNSVFSVGYSPDFRYLLSTGRDAHLRIWDVANEYNMKEEIVAHMYTINHLAFSPDGKHFVTCSMDKSIKVWDATEFRLLKVIDKARHAGHGTSVNKLFWSGYNNLLVSGSDDRTLSVWNIIFD